MYKLMAIIWLRIRLIFKSKIAVIMMFVLPLVFSTIFAGMGLNNKKENNNPNVGLVVEECYECDAVSQYVRRHVNYNWIELDLESAKDAVSEGSVIAAIIIPSDIFMRLKNSDPVFDVIVNNKAEEYIPLSQYIDGVANQIHMFKTTLKITDQTYLIKDAIDYVNSVPPVQFENEYYQGNIADTDKQITSSTTMTIGFAVMFMMFAIANNASAIHTERKQYSWQRLLLTGTSPIAITIGTMLAYFIVGWLQFGVVILFMKFVYGVYWGNITYLILFSSIMIITVVSFSMLIMTLFNSKEKSDTMSAIIIVSTCMLGGVYWPIELVPQVMKIIGGVMPQFWMMKGLEYGLLNQTSIDVVWKPISILLGVTSVFTFIVIKTMNKESKLT